MKKVVLALIEENGKFVLINRNSQPKVMEKYEIETAEWIPAENVLAKFTSDVAPQIKNFILKVLRGGILHQP